MRAHLLPRVLKAPLFHAKIGMHILS